MTQLEVRALLTTPTVTALDISAASLTYGQTEVLTATVATDPPSSTTPTGGTVTFMDGTTSLMVEDLTGGTASYSTSGLGTGNHVLTAVYSGAAGFGGSSTPTAAAGTIITVGGGGVGDTDPGGAASLNQPTGVAVDGSGDLFIADTQHNRVREVNPSTGVITTVAGDGVSGSFGYDVPAVTAELNGPAAVAVDGSGHLYIADAGNNQVREVDLSTGIITTVAGNSIGGYAGDNSLAISAELGSPQGVAVDNSGHLYIADTGNNVIREVDLATGIITTIAGGGSNSSATYSGSATGVQLNAPRGLALDGSGDLFIADSGNDVIREVDLASDTISTVVGDGTPSVLNNPTGVALDGSGDLFIADQGNQVVQELPANSGVLATIAGNGSEGYSGDGIATRTS